MCVLRAAVYSCGICALHSGTQPRKGVAWAVNGLLFAQNDNLLLILHTIQEILQLCDINLEPPG